MTQRLDAGAGWYGEFLRRDPEGMRACLDGAAIPPWDVMESLLRDLAGAAGAELAARETVYAARLRAAAVTVWDRLPGGEEELRTLLAAAAAQRAGSEAALRSLTARLGGSADRAETDALTRELSWTQDDMARAAARHEDLAARLAALETTPSPTARHQGSPHPPRPATRTEPRPAPAAGPDAGAPGAGAWRASAPGNIAPAMPHARPQAPDGAGAGAWRVSVPGGGATADPAASPHAGPQVPDGAGAGAWRASVPGGGASAEPAASPGARPQAPDGAGAGAWRASVPGGGAPAEPAAVPHPAAPAPGGGGDEAAAESAALPPVGRAEGRWLRGARRAGGARYAGAAAAQAQVFTPPPGHPDAEAAGGPGSPQGRSVPRGARFGRPEPEPQPEPEPRPERATAAETAPAPAQPAGRPRAVAAELLTLRAQGRTGEAHALLCQAAAWPAGQLPELAAELARAGLAADWTTLLWEAASLPPEQLAAAAAALGDAGREADRDALLRQGVARPSAEVADAALALGAAGRNREADALLGAFVRVRTAEEAAALARHDPRWLAPRLLHAAGLLPGARHRDLLHALRVAGIVAP
ncbi:hypothetical protein [Streptomyces amritsarensis]|uniref:hypothetical protein n=1 Tax=Streptomyces amritsarensis TaxID=681158 RepID=UPI001300F6BE|nr:hypothetical protein [Streptomyces amritsarensis]